LLIVLFSRESGIVVEQTLTFSIIIPTYNRSRQLVSCLQALVRLNYPRERFEVIVVDDGSHTPLNEVVQPFHDRIAVTLVRQANAGPAAARNAGAAGAQGQFLVFTDDDCAPDQRWLQVLADHFVATPDALIGGHVINAHRPNFCSEASQQLVDYLYAYFGDGPKPGYFFTSNNLAVAAERFHTLGGFDASFPLAAGEDREFCDRWHAAGHRMIYVPEAIVYHAHTLTLRSFCRQHFHYGRGAFAFHQARARRNQTGIKTEPLWFYLRLVQYPLSHSQGWRRPILVGLLAITQVANVAGFFWEKLRTRRRLLDT
jgi:GT2 family glycosyltransferase